MRHGMTKKPELWTETEITFLYLHMGTLKELHNYKVGNVHISTIVPGDTILCADGNLRTVCRKDIKRDSFMGRTLFGDPYRLGTVPVKKATFTSIKENK